MQCRKPGELRLQLGRTNTDEAEGRVPSRGEAEQSAKSWRQLHEVGGLGLFQHQHRRAVLSCEFFQSGREFPPDPIAPGGAGIDLRGVDAQFDGDPRQQFRRLPAGS